MVDLVLDARRVPGGFAHSGECLALGVDQILSDDQCLVLILIWSWLSQLAFSYSRVDPVGMIPSLPKHSILPNLAELRADL